jgi:lysophospholipase L1-like esterase
VAGSLAAALAAAEGVLVWLDYFDPPAFVTDETFGYVMRPSQSVSTRGQRFQINSHGLRGREIPAARTPGTSRVAFLGDSITYGGGSVGDGDLFTERIGAALTERLHRPIETVNISAPGWGIENIARYVRTNGTLHSDLVVWVIPAVDFRRPFSRIEYHSFPTVRRPFRLQYLFALGRYTIRARSADAPARQPANASTPEVLRQNIATLKAMLTAWQQSGVQAIVVFVPGRDGYGEHDDLADYSRAVADSGVVIQDTQPAFRADAATENYLDDMHLTAAGHAIVAEQLAPVLVDLLRRRGPN